MTNFFSSASYQTDCLTRPIGSSLMIGGAFTAYDVMARGASSSSIPRIAAVNVGGLYVYHSLQCPMEAIHGRQSLLHNVLSGGMLGLVGVRQGVLGIPFVDSYFFYRNPSLSPEVTAFAVYGAIGGLMASLGGKPL